MPAEVLRVYRRLRLPDFMLIGKCVSPMHRPPLSARKYYWYSCLLEPEYDRKDYDNKNFQRHHTEIETATFRIVACVPQKIHHRVRPVYTERWDILLCKLSPASKWTAYKLGVCFRQKKNSLTALTSKLAFRWYKQTQEAKLAADTYLLPKFEKD